MTHLLLVGAWPELAAELVGLPARVTLLQLEGMPGGSDLTPYARWAHRFAVAPWSGSDQILKVAEGIHLTDPVAVVAGYGEFALAAVASIASRLGVRAVPNATSGGGQDKAEQRALLAKGGCREVGSRICVSPAEAGQFGAQYGYPIILKPAAGNGSLGVCAVTTPDDLERGWRWASEAGLGAVLAEELLSGPEYSVEVRSVGSVHEVLMVTEKINSGAPHFVETGHIMPARLEPAEVQALSAEATLALQAIGHTDGPAHVELILTSAGAAVVEVNRRLGGDRLWELLHLTTDRNVLRQTLLDAIGTPSDEQPTEHASGHPTQPTANTCGHPRQPTANTSGDPTQETRTTAACIRFLHGDDTMFGTGLPPRPEQEPPATPGLVRFRWEPTTYHRRTAYVLTHANTPDEALQAAETACATVPDAPPSGTVTH